MKPLTEFYSGGTYCKTCTSDYNKRYSKTRRKTRKGSIESGVLECTRCHQLLPLDKFYYRQQSNSYDSWCNACRNEICKHDKDKKRDTKYNLLPGQFDRLDISQNRVCAICGKPNQNGKRLVVDHDHLNDSVRGLLCDKCNRGIGHFDDNISLLKKAIEYLKHAAK
jgi:hypothetical protein